MRKPVLILILMLLMLTFGCGRTDKDEDARHTAARLEKMSRELESASGRLDRIESELASVQKNTEAIKKLLEEMSGGIDFGEGYASVKEKSGAVIKEMEALSDDIASIMETLENLSEEVGSTRSEMANLGSANREVAERTERRQNWEDMGDREKLAAKLDEFTNAYAPKLEESGRKEQFEAAMEAYKAEATGEYTTEELVAKYTERLNERISEGTDDRRTGFFERQLEELQNATGEDLDEMVSNYTRFTNSRELARIIEEYEIPREEVQQHGLIVFGRRGRGGRGGRGGSGR